MNELEVRRPRLQGSSRLQHPPVWGQWFSYRSICFLLQANISSILWVLVLHTLCYHWLIKLVFCFYRFHFTQNVRHGISTNVCLAIWAKPSLARSWSVDSKRTTPHDQGDLSFSCHGPYILEPPLVHSSASWISSAALAVSWTTNSIRTIQPP